MYIEHNYREGMDIVWYFQMVNSSDSCYAWQSCYILPQLWTVTLWWHKCNYFIIGESHSIIWAVDSKNVMHNKSLSFSPSENTKQYPSPRDSYVQCTWLLLSKSFKINAEMEEMHTESYSPNTRRVTSARGELPTHGYRAVSPLLSARSILRQTSRVWGVDHQLGSVH